MASRYPPTPSVAVQMADALYLDEIHEDIDPGHGTVAALKSGNFEKVYLLIHGRWKFFRWATREEADAIYHSDSRYITIEDIERLERHA